MRPTIAGLLCLVAATAAFPADTMAAEITVHHAQGETEVASPPAKALVLDINALDILDALGVEPAGVVGSNLPPYLSKYADSRFLKVGTLFEPDYEAIDAAGADLMIVGGRSSAVYPQLSAMLPTIDLTVDAENFTDSVREHVQTLGAIFDREDRADELVATLDARIASLKETAASTGTALILVTNAGKLGAYGPGSRVGWLHKEIGFKTVEENIDDRFDRGDVVSFEYILERNPEWLFVIDRDAAIGQGTPGSAARAVLDNDLVHQTDAWKQNRIVYLDPAAAYISSGGYTSLLTLIDQVQAAVSGT